MYYNVKCFLLLKLKQGQGSPMTVDNKYRLSKGSLGIASMRGNLTGSSTAYVHRSETQGEMQTLSSSNLLRLLGGQSAARSESDHKSRLRRIYSDISEDYKKGLIDNDRFELELRKAVADYLAFEFDRVLKKYFNEILT